LIAAYLARVRALAAEGRHTPGELLAALAVELADREGSDLPVIVGGLLESEPSPARVEGLGPPDGVPGPDLLGMVHEVLAERGDRRRRGAFYTPTLVAQRLVDVAFEQLDGRRRPRLVCDPACGGGAFLLAMGRRLARDGVPRDEIVAERLWGIDLDPLAAAVSRTALALWAAETGPGPQATHVAVADALIAGRSAWEPDAPHFDAVVGNPPFQGQLASDTARSVADNAVLRARLGPAAVGYADTAALFVAAGLEMADDGGAVAFILPESYLVARDAGASRAAALDHGTLVGIWMADEALFDDAAVRVCAPIIRKGSSADGPVRRWVGTDFTDLGAPPPGATTPTGSGTWAPLVADRHGHPTVDLRDRPPLSSIARATAGFRDQYYGLVGHVVDRPTDGTDGTDGAGPVTHVPLVTSGLIDPARSLWGERAARFARRSWTAPMVDLAALERDQPALARWGRALLVPKVLVASQTRVIEVVVDLEGRWWPSVPVVAVTSPADRLWHVAAALQSPPVTAWAMANYAGAALTGDALKLAASQVLAAPLPDDTAAWQCGADALRRAASAAAAGDAAGWRDLMLESARAMCDAYGVEQSVTDWWSGRLPPFRLPASTTEGN
jgi:hypothetical protein